MYVVLRRRALGGSTALFYSISMAAKTVATSVPKATVVVVPALLEPELLPDEPEPVLLAPAAEPEDWAAAVASATLMP